MPRPGETFACQAPFEERPELVGLIDIWGAKIDDLDEGATVLGVAADEMLQITRTILLEQCPDVDPDEVVGEINMTNAAMWSTRALLAASSIKKIAHSLSPEDLV